ncbi:MAG: tRNA-dihydrouridine synthase [Planctomycetota bacterium]
MSVELDPSALPERQLSRPIEEIARETAVDPRIPAEVPGFDAPFFQAGLAGFSDAAMRLLARKHGAPYCLTEALLDRFLLGLEAKPSDDRREDPNYLEEFLGEARAHDHPIAGQVMGTEPDEMAAAAARLVELGYDTIDVNFACPVKKISRKNRGGHFLAAPFEAKQVLAAVRAAVPEGTSTSVKLRRGFDESDEAAFSFETIFDAAYELGYSWATVHCRTVEQKYKGPGRWEALRELTERYPDRVIFGSGDIWRVEDIFAMLELTGVHAVSVARGAIGNPWIFRDARTLMAGDAPRAPSLLEQSEVLLEHVELSVALYGEWLAPRFMRKFAQKFSLLHPNGADVRRALVGCKTIEEWRAAIELHYPISPAE